MRIISGVVPGASPSERLQAELSIKAKQRLKWFDYYNARYLIYLRDAIILTI